MTLNWKPTLLFSLPCAGLAWGAITLVQVDVQKLADGAVAKTISTFHGYYGDLQADGVTTEVNRETFQLRFAEDGVTVFGESRGPATYQGRVVQRKWRITGVNREPRLVLNILTVASEQDPKPPTGIGTYYLARTADGSYTGTALYLNCEPKPVVVECPYAMTATELNEAERREKWPGLYERKCAPVDLSLSSRHADLTC